jgi:hypothetical protein
MCCRQINFVSRLSSSPPPSATIGRARERISPRTRSIAVLQREARVGRGRPCVRWPSKTQSLLIIWQYMDTERFTRGKEGWRIRYCTSNNGRLPKVAFSLFLSSSPFASYSLSNPLLSLRVSDPWAWKLLRKPFPRLRRILHIKKELWPLFGFFYEFQYAIWC